MQRLIPNKDFVSHDEFKFFWLLFFLAFYFKFK